MTTIEQLDDSDAVRFHRQKDGKWTFTIDKPSMSEGTITKLAQKLLTHLSGSD